MSAWHPWYEVRMNVRPDGDGSMPTEPLEWLKWFCSNAPKFVDDLRLEMRGPTGRHVLPQEIVEEGGSIE